MKLQEYRDIGYLQPGMLIEFSHDGVPPVHALVIQTSGYGFGWDHVCVLVGERQMELRPFLSGHYGVLWELKDGRDRVRYQRLEVIRSVT